MKLVTGILLALAAVGVVAILFIGPSGSRECWADGSYPVWMLEKQDWDGLSCVVEYQWWEAPPGADWRLYCTGMCTELNNPSDVSFPQLDDEEDLYLTESHKRCHSQSACSRRQRSSSVSGRTHRWRRSIWANGTPVRNFSGGPDGRFRA